MCNGRRLIKEELRKDIDDRRRRPAVLVSLVVAHTETYFYNSSPVHLKYRRVLVPVDEQRRTEIQTNF